MKVKDMAIQQCYSIKVLEEWGWEIPSKWGLLDDNYTFLPRHPYPPPHEEILCVFSPSWPLLPISSLSRQHSASVPFLCPDLSVAKRGESDFPRRSPSRSSLSYLSCCTGRKKRRRSDYLPLGHGISQQPPKKWSVSLYNFVRSRYSLTIAVSWCYIVNPATLPTTCAMQWSRFLSEHSVWLRFLSRSQYQAKRSHSIG